jgi:hypothetical protein
MLTYAGVGLLLNKVGERDKDCHSSSTCNRWQASTGELCGLAPDDIVALRALKETKTESEPG